MNIFNMKSSMLLLLTTFTLLIICCSCTADDLYDQSPIGDMEVVDRAIFDVVGKEFLKGLKGLSNKLGQPGLNRGVGFGRRVYRGYRKVYTSCMQTYDCVASDPVCGAYCIYTLTADTGEVVGCEMSTGCSKNLPAEDCQYYSDGTYTCN